MTTIREPTTAERADLFLYFHETVGFDAHNAIREAHRESISVIDGYASDTPGYSGRLIQFVGGEPAAHETLQYREEKCELVRVESAHEATAKFERDLQ